MQPLALLPRMPDFDGCDIATGAGIAEDALARVSANVFTVKGTNAVIV